MQVVLYKNVAGLGKRGEVVEVSDGYARNKLLRSGEAVEATPKAVLQAKTMQRNREIADVHNLENAQKMAEQLAARQLQAKSKAGPDGRLFGSVTAADIAKLVAEETGTAVDRRSVILSEPIKSVGVREVTLKLHSEVEAILHLEVVAE